MVRLFVKSALGRFADFSQGQYLVAEGSDGPLVRDKRMGHFADFFLGSFGICLESFGYCLGCSCNCLVLLGICLELLGICLELLGICLELLGICLELSGFCLVPLGASRGTCSILWMPCSVRRLPGGMYIFLELSVSVFRFLSTNVSSFPCFSAISAFQPQKIAETPGAT